MTDYYVNKNPQEIGYHHVHTHDCSFLPSAEMRIYIGKFTRCQAAVAQARTYFSRVDGCLHCSTACHRR